MGIHPGPLAPTPTTTLPSEVIRVLGKLALEGATAHVHIRSGVDSLLGDTHLVVVGGKLHVVARRSSLDPLEDVPLLALPEIDEEGYRSVLQLRTPAGDKRVEIGATEENAVHAMVGALTPDVLDLAPTPPSVTASPAAATPDEAAPREAAPDLEASRAALLGLVNAVRGEAGPRDRDEVRAALIGVLAMRLQQRRAKLRADRIAHERRPKQPAKREAPVALHAEVGVATTDEDGDGVPDPPGDTLRPERRAAPPAVPAPGMSPLQLGLSMLLVLAIVGFALHAAFGR